MPDDSKTFCAMQVPTKEMKGSFSDWLFHLAAGFGSLVYVFIKPEKKWWLNAAKFGIGYLSAIFTAPLILGIFQYFFNFSQESFEAYLPASGFVTGVLSMTFFEAMIAWIRGDLRPLLTQIIESWLKRKNSTGDVQTNETENTDGNTA